MLNKILIAVFVALFTVIMVEVGYLIFYKPEPLSNRATLNAASVTSSFTFPFGSSIFDFLNAFDTGILQSAVVTADFEGQIVKVINKPGKEGTVEYEEGLLLRPLNQPRTQKNTRSMLFRKTDLPVIKVYTNLFIFRREIKFDDLKAGD